MNNSGAAAGQQRGATRQSHENTAPSVQVVRGSSGAAAGRDPRVNPVAGDIIRRSGDAMAFHVLRVDGLSITGRFGRYGHEGNLCGLAYWRTWAKDAAILARGDS